MGALVSRRRRWAGMTALPVGKATLSARPPHAAAVLESAYPIDLDGDARTDLVYPQTNGSNTNWYSMRANGSGQYLDARQ